MVSHGKLLVPSLCRQTQHSVAVWSAEISQPWDTLLAMASHTGFPHRSRESIYFRVKDPFY